MSQHHGEKKKVSFQHYKGDLRLSFLCPPPSPHLPHRCLAVLLGDVNVTSAEIRLQHSVCVDIEATWTQWGLLFGPLTCCLSSIPPPPSRCRFHPPPSDLWHGHRLHLSVLEHRVRRERRLHAVRQRGLQASVRQHRHRAQVVSLRALHHHVAVSEEELQEVHQERRGLPHADRTLLLQRDSGQSGQGDHAEPSQQDQVHIQPGGPGDVRQHGVSFIVLLLGENCRCVSLCAADLIFVAVCRLGRVSPSCFHPRNLTKWRQAAQ